MKFLVKMMLSFCLSWPLLAQGIAKNNDFEVSSGISLTLYQSVYSFQESAAFETAIRKNLSGQWDWQAGIRLGLSPVLPDLFVRLLAAPEVGAWQPFVAFEMGYTNRAHFEAGEKLLQESRAAMEGDISHFYLAGHSAPLSFHVGKNWRLSLFELHVGTHFGHTGRTLRVQTGLFSLGKSF